MDRFALSVAVLSVAVLLSSAAQAMEIQQYDKMADRDQAEYVGLLVEGAEKVLTDEGRSDLATKTHQLIMTTPTGDKMSLLMTEFERNLALARVADANRAAQDPNARRVRVEDAMGVTLKKNGIDLPQSFFTINSNFRPKYPPQKP